MQKRKHNNFDDKLMTYEHYVKRVRHNDVKQLKIF